MSRTSRSGFTLIELLIVISIIAIMIGLLLPAVQKVREAANRAHCMNNLHQVSLALLNYEVNHGVLPPAMVPKKGNWRHEILTFIEQKPIFDCIQPDKSWFEGDNLEKVAKSPIPIFLCPSVNPRADVRWLIIDRVPKSETDRSLPGNDFEAVLGIDSHQYLEVMQKEEKDPIQLVAITRGAMVPKAPTKVQDLTDGASNTILLAESVGRPNIFGTPRPPNGMFSVGAGEGITGMNFATCWADPSGPFELKIPDHPAGAGSPQMIFSSNFNQPYSFHSGGANFALLDGSVRFLGQRMDLPIFFAMVTASGNDLVYEN